MAQKHRSKIAKADLTLEQILAGENAEALLAGLNLDERRVLDEIVNEIRQSNQSEVLNKLWLFDYTRKPPSMHEFLNDEYWLGGVTKMTEENVGLWPTWKKLLERDWDLDSRIHNAVITGSLGSGKTFNAVLIILYRFVVASLLRNPQNFVGLAAGSPIIYCLLSVTRQQVGETAWAAALNMMGRSPYFVEELKFDPDAKYAGQVINFPKNLQLSAGSKGQHILGRNSLGVLLDEGNFRLESNPDQKAYKLYGEIRTRIKNRFQKRSGFLPAISIIASSAADESSFTETIMDEIEKVADKKVEIVYSNSVYALKNAKRWAEQNVDKTLIELHANKYSDDYFKVAYGLKNVSPTILRGVYTESGKPVRPPFDEAPVGSKTELVPVDYLPDYRRDIIGSLQSLSGISIGGSYRLFTSLVDLDYAVTEGTRIGLVNPCTVPTINLSEEDDREIWDFLDHKTFLVKQAGQIRPRRHPGALRFAHMDLATRSQCGISICHMVGWKDVMDLVDRKSGKVFQEQRLIVEYDFILSITGGAIRPISFEKIQKFFLWLRDICSFQFGLITADTFQSFMQLEMLNTRGFQTGSLSLDRSKSAYYAWRAGIEERRVLMFPHEGLMNEAEYLIDGPKMVDHPTAGPVTTKDLTDGAAGAYYNCIISGQTGITSEGAEPPAMTTGAIVVQGEEPQILQLDTEPVRRVVRRYVSR